MVTLFRRLYLWNGMTNSRAVILIRVVPVLGAEHAVPGGNFPKFEPVRAHLRNSRDF